MLLKTGQMLIAQSEQLEYEPKIHLIEPYEISGNTKVTLRRWPFYTDDIHILLNTDALLTVCEPSTKIKEAYIKKVGITEEDLKSEPSPVMLTEDENVPEMDDYEPRYIEEPVY